MAGILRTLAQCHTHNIIYRDVKATNYMFSSKEPNARLKAIDFGLAVPFDKEDDLTDLPQEGTPWCCPSPGPWSCRSL
jgi:calcium-dependent protein kinase